MSPPTFKMVDFISNSVIRTFPLSLDSALCTAMFLLNDEMKQLHYTSMLFSFQIEFKSIQQIK